MFLPSPDNPLLGSPSSPLNGRHRLALQFDVGPALAAAAAENYSICEPLQRSPANRGRCGDFASSL
jgi:hypothetical protein